MYIRPYIHVHARVSIYIYIYTHETLPETPTAASQRAPYMHR